MSKYSTAEEMAQAFIESGWNENTRFIPFDESDAIRIGVIGLNLSKRKLFFMEGSGNIYDDNGEIYMYNVPVINDREFGDVYDDRFEELLSSFDENTFCCVRKNDRKLFEGEIRDFKERTSEEVKGHRVKRWNVNSNHTLEIELYPTTGISFETCENLAENFEMLKEKSYKAYQLDWMISHEYSLEDLRSVLFEIYHECCRNGLIDGSTNCIEDAETVKDGFVDAGFNGALYACKEEFLGAEFLDKDYMKHLISSMPESTKWLYVYEQATREGMM